MSGRSHLFIEQTAVQVGPVWSMHFLSEQFENNMKHRSACIQEAQEAGRPNLELRF
jgi:hypothetical protein